jgi:hypothetical protein
MPRSLPGGRTASTQSDGAKAAVAAAAAYEAAPVGTPVTLPSYITPARAAIITGETPIRSADAGLTIIKPAPGQSLAPPEAAPAYDDTDADADGTPDNPYLSLLGGGPATLTDASNAGGIASADDGGRDIPWLLGAIVLVVGLLGWFLLRRR